MSSSPHLRQLEAESVHILREVAAECQKPVLLYSIGKDSSVLLRLAQKAFHPGPIPFPLLHVDTGYKFREMIEFRDRYTAALGVKLIPTPDEPRTFLIRLFCTCSAAPVLKWIPPVAELSPSITRFVPANVTTAPQSRCAFDVIVAVSPGFTMITTLFRGPQF